MISKDNEGSKGSQLAVVSVDFSFENGSQDRRSQSRDKSKSHNDFNNDHVTQINKDKFYHPQGIDN